MVAALAGAGHMATYLLTLGADPALLCTNGSSALSAAASACSPRVVKMLLHHNIRRQRCSMAWSGCCRRHTQGWRLTG